MWKWVHVVSWCADYVLSVLQVDSVKVRECFQLMCRLCSFRPTSRYCESAVHVASWCADYVLSVLPVDSVKVRECCQLMCRLCSFRPISRKCESACMLSVDVQTMFFPSYLYVVWKCVHVVSWCADYVLSVLPVDSVKVRACCQLMCRLCSFCPTSR